MPSQKQYLPHEVYVSQRKVTQGGLARIAVGLLLGSLALVVLVGGIGSRAYNAVRRTALASTDYTGNFDWGVTNPETGVMRVGCGSSVADDDRFWGAVGTTYTVECPAHCGHYGERSVFGCDVFMDSSSICRAAIARRFLGHENSGIVKFQIEEPIEEYPACSKMPLEDNCVKYPGCGPSKFVEEDEGAATYIETEKWIWHTWSRGTRADKVALYGEAGAIEKYRTHLHASGYRYGVRAFRMVDGNVNLAIEAKAQGDMVKLTDGATKLSGAIGSAITVEAWVRDHSPAEESGYVSAATHGSTMADVDTGVILGTRHGSFAFGLSSVGPKKMSYVEAPAFITAQNKGNWTHIAGTYDGSDMLLYINGEPIGCDKVQDGNVLFGNDDLLFLAQKLAGAAVTSIAEMDEIRIWSYARTEAEIKSHMHKTFEEPLAHQLVVYFRFDGEDTSKEPTKACSETSGWGMDMVAGATFVDSSVPVEALSESSVCHASA